MVSCQVKAWLQVQGHASFRFGSQDQEPRDTRFARFYCILDCAERSGGRSSRLDWKAASPCSTGRLGGFAFRRRRILKPRRRAVLFFLGTLYGVDRKPNVLGLVSAWFKPPRWAAQEKRDGLGFRLAIAAHSYQDCQLFWQDFEQLKRIIFHGKSCSCTVIYNASKVYSIP